MKKDTLIAKYDKMNKNVIGINWQLVNQDRRQVGQKAVEIDTVKK